MTPQQFIAKWGAPGGVAGPAYALNEEQGAQSHFLDLCELLAVPKPGSAEGYLFEEKSAVIGGKTGYADVFMRGVFAWKNKAPGRNLDAVLKQLLTYSLALSNPPILVVSDRLTIRIHAQFTGHPSQTHSVSLEELDQPDKLALLRRIWTAPESFKPQITNRDITEAAARSFANLAEGLRRWGAEPQPETVIASAARQSMSVVVDSEPGAQVGQMPMPLDASKDDAVANRVAHFLTQCLFCFFAEDIGLLPGHMFERLVNNRHITPAKLTQGLGDLFQAMAEGGMFGADDIPWFNGGLFKTIDVPQLSILDVTELRNAADLNWSAIDVSIFGTLFERGLDPAKRSQLGAHYTDPATIDRIIDPVLRRPLLHKWELIARAIQALQAKSTQKKRPAYSAGGRHFKATPGDAAFQKAQALFYGWLDELKNFRILDPACGSGNFLFMGLKALKDIEHQSHLEAASFGLDREADLVTGPHNVLGIELNGYAAELARVTVWIGELQWRMAHGYEFKRNPVLEPLEHIECRDALLSFSVIANKPLAARSAATWREARQSKESVIASEARQSMSVAVDSEPVAREAQTPGPHALRSLKSAPTSAPPTPLSDVGTQVTEAPWPQANVVIGNPPFLGDRKMIRELGEDYTATLRRVYEGRVPGGADLVCYWFEKARTAMAQNGLTAAGLVATNSIRGGKNRAVLDAIAKTTSIFETWSDESWVNNGAAVRVSLVAFGRGYQSCRLNGLSVNAINADLTSGGDCESKNNDLTQACKLPENTHASFIGTQKNGPFDIARDVAVDWLLTPNPNGRSSALVLRPWANGLDVTRRPQDRWVIDFGCDMTLSEAALFETPFGHIEKVVKPTRGNVRRDWHRDHWWLFGDARPGLRQKLASLPRFVVTPMVAKYRVFAWLPAIQIPENLCVAITRADDTTFGILHSRFHELWSLRMCTWLGVGNDPRYTPTTCFETFPFPAGLTPLDTAHQRTETLPDGAVIPADIHKQNRPTAPVEKAQYAIKEISNPVLETSSSEVGLARMSSKTKRSEAPASEPAPPGSTRNAAIRDAAINIAQAAKKLNDLRDNWLNPPEWTHKVPEVTPLGLEKSPYPDRIEPKPGISEQDLKALQKRTLTNLYNAKPAWLTMAHQQLDQAVAAAYGWADYTAAMPDDEILKRLLALNLARSPIISGTNRLPIV